MSVQLADVIVSSVIALAGVIASSVIALLVFCILFVQWRTNKARLKHELFDRRFSIFEKIGGFLSEVLRFGEISNKRIDKFLQETKCAYFAFGCDENIKTLVNNIYEKACKLHALQAVKKNNHTKEQRIKNWFSGTLNSLESTFEKYLKLKH